MILDDHINLLNLFVVAILVCFIKVLYILSSYIDFYMDSLIDIWVTLYLQKTVYYILFIFPCLD